MGSFKNYFSNILTESLTLEKIKEQIHKGKYDLPNPDYQNNTGQKYWKELDKYNEECRRINSIFKSDLSNYIKANYKTPFEIINKKVYDSKEMFNFLKSNNYSKSVKDTNIFLIDLFDKIAKES